jgi:hypothetical protein
MGLAICVAFGLGLFGRKKILTIGSKKEWLKDGLCT